MSVVAVSCVAAWLGITAFFSFGVAPLAFNIMERTAAGQVVAAVLPRSYITGLGLCAVALAGVEERHGFAGALRALGGVGGHIATPHVDSPACSRGRPWW